MFSFVVAAGRIAAREDSRPFPDGYLPADVWLHGYAHHLLVLNHTVAVRPLSLQ